MERAVAGGIGHPRILAAERGFTLIELLIVVVIIGVLAAIAVPAYVGQQDRARDTAAQAELRNAATAQQLFFTENGNYAGDVAALAGHGYRPGAQGVTVASGGGNSYCMEAAGGGASRFHITEAEGRPRTGAC